MEDDIFRTTLAYTKSPKTSRRTNFQDELEAAVSARARRHKATESTSYYSDDFDDDDDDILNELLKTRRKKMDIFKTGRTKAKLNEFKLSDDEEENVRPKKVSFLKTRRGNSPLQDDQIDSGKSRRSNTVGSSESQDSFPSYQGRNTSEKSEQDTHSTFQSESPVIRKKQSESSMSRKSQTESLTSRQSLSESPLPLPSENSQRDSLLPLEGSFFNSQSEQGEETLRMIIGAEDEQPLPQPRERSSRQRSLTGLVKDMPPMPRPRQRSVHMGSSGHDEEDGAVETLSSRAATSSVSIPLSFTDGHTITSASSERMGSSGSERVQYSEEPHTSVNSHFSSSAQRISVGTTLEGVGRTEPNKEDKYSTSFEEHQEGSVDASRATASWQSQSTFKSQDRPPSSRPTSSRKSRSACSNTAESKYLGTLKVLDQNMPLQQSQPDAADSLRAAIYQDWLKKKEEKIQADIKAKNEEQQLKEEKKSEEEMSKKAEAKASYEAWKKKKQEATRETIRKRQESVRKQQKEMEEKEEKKETAKRVFEKWKQEQDSRLQEQQRKKAQEKNRLKEKKEKEEEERKKECNSTFTQWNEKKNDAIQEKVKEERKKEKIKEIEEKYQKDEREKSALEMYEKWLKRKEFQQKRDKHQQKIKVIVQEEPAPPWSPPNRTIPFGK